MVDNDRIMLSVPARGEFARTVRLAAAELAARAGMCVDDVDDVRLAVEEAFVYACERADADHVTFAFTLGPGLMELLVGPLPVGTAGDDGSEPGERYARFILESVCDEYEVLAQDDANYIRLLKRTA